MTATQAAARCGGPRLPFDALEQLVGGGCGLATARALGVHPRQVYRWRSTGVSWALADELAVRAGMHPSDVWGRAWWSE